MEQADIVLVGVNASWSHPSFGLRFLLANMGDLTGRTHLLERTIKHAPLDVVEAVLALDPRVVGVGVYIWNVRETLAFARILKALRPEISLVIGGPEVSHEWRDQPLFAIADHLVVGEADEAFAALCRSLLASESAPKVLQPVLPAIDRLNLPYQLYTDTDVQGRVIYVEASRGCPFKCEFCLSALDQKVRAVPLEPFLAAMKDLHERGNRVFKFVDRTFNLSAKTGAAILEFFLDLGTDDLFLHFEMIPDRFPAVLKTLIERFPAGTVQFEVGVQTLNPEVAANISRRQSVDKTLGNLRYLVEQTGVHVHSDLIVGLPGEDLASFARGFDTLLGTGVQEIQVGILKRLRGAPIARHTDTFAMVYNPEPPYEILRNADLSTGDLARMRRFAQYWDTIANSGRFRTSLPLLLGRDQPTVSAFSRFLALSDALYAEHGRSHAISFDRLIRSLFKHAQDGEESNAPGANLADIATALIDDRCRVSGKPHVPAFLQAWAASAEARYGSVSNATPSGHTPTDSKTPKRQLRHL